MKVDYNELRSIYGSEERSDEWFIFKFILNTGTSQFMKLKYLTTNPVQTKNLGEILAKEILTPHHFLKKGETCKNRMKSGGGQKKALVIGLEGDLGGGKTTFLQGLAKGLGIKEKILSPSFVLIKKFGIPHRFFQFFYHLDCYRIEKPKEILDLGFKEIISNPQNIIAIEWADRIKKIIPKGTIWISFEFVDKNKRKIMIKPR